MLTASWVMAAIKGGEEVGHASLSLSTVKTQWPWTAEGTQRLGMGDDAVRGWVGWHQHRTLVILAHFFVVRLRLRLKKKRRP